MSTKSPTELPSYAISIPSGIELAIEKDNINVKGSAGQISRFFPKKKLEIITSEGKVTIKARDKSAETRMIAGAFASHIKNMFAGAQKPFVYKLKVAFTHFPITVSVSGNDFLVQNFLGEKKPRKTTIPKGVKVSVQNNIIIVESADLESAGRTATLIEQITRISNKDRRIYQDGIYIIEKGK